MQGARQCKYFSSLGNVLGSLQILSHGETIAWVFSWTDNLVAGSNSTLILWQWYNLDLVGGQDRDIKVVFFYKTSKCRAYSCVVSGW